VEFPSRFQVVCLQTVFDLYYHGETQPQAEDVPVSTKSANVSHSIRTAVHSHDLSVSILEQVRLLLRGGSVVDWYKLGFANEGVVRDFLRVNSFDVDDPADEERVRMLFRLAHEYLSDDLGYAIADHIWNPDSVLTPFLIASNAVGEEQQAACILLKVVHTINHLQARELRHNLPLPDAEIFETVEERVGGRMEKLIDEGLPIAQFAGGRKTLESTLTKLLSKRRATAAEILDRLRFRIIVNTSTDIPLVLARMIQTVLPFNYVIPEESTNDIVNVRRYFNSLATIDTERLKELQFDLALEETDPLRRQFNECSAERFRMLNFVVDLPIRVDHVLERPEYEHLKRLGHLVFVSVEFQVFDRETFDYNERDSDASHKAYKMRQKERVRHRLEIGLEVHNNALRSQMLGLKRSEK
jgi:uncharacterized protein (TIGR04552 family)